jgi:hypothetical protein
VRYRNEGKLAFYTYCGGAALLKTARGLAGGK